MAALDAFARVRGGAVVLLPDRRPAGPFLSLLPPSSFDEILLDRPAALDAERVPGVHVSEIAAPAAIGRGGVALASVQQGGARRAVVVSWPRGAGRVLFSGALDAWRYRARDEDGFARFWSAMVAGLAASAPPRVAVSLDPPIARPGESVRARVTVRSTEIVATGTPPVEARIVSADGSERLLRLWPTAERGVFEGHVPAPSPGRYDVRATLSGKAAAADAGLVVAEDVVHAEGDPGPALRWAAESTGGLVVGPDELESLASFLRKLPRPDPVVAVHPMRSPWWMAPFAGALSAAWAMGRRRGLR